MENLIINDVERNIYLRNLVLGKTFGPITYDPTIDKPYLKFFDEESLRNYKIVEKTAFQYGYDARKNNLQQIGYNFLGTKITYIQYYKLVYNIVKSLYYLGIKKGDYVAVNSPNSIETFSFIDALWFIGATPTIFDPRAKDEELLTYLNEVDCKMILTMDQFASNLESVIAKTNIDKVIVMDITTYMNFVVGSYVKFKKPPVKFEKSFITWKQFLSYAKKNDNCYYPNEFKSGTPCSIAHTSGTSVGVPKGTIITNENINTISEQYRLSSFKFFESERFLSPTPIHLIYGLSLKHLAHAMGVINYIQPEYNPSMTAKMVIQNKINHLGAGTADADALKEELKKKKDNYDASYIKTIATGGGKYNQVLKNECMQELKKHNCFINITEGYGLTENTGPAITNFPNAYKENSMGIPFPYVDIMIVNPDTLERVNPGESGELLICSDSTTKGYVGREDLTNQLFVTINGKKYLHTKDKVRMDSDGFIFFEGRYSNIIPLYTGENISPHAIEEIVEMHYAVKDCIVIGIKDPNHIQGEVPCVNFVLEPGYENANIEKIVNEIKNNCQKALKEEYIPSCFVIVNKIMHTKNGKVDYVGTKEINNKELDSGSISLIKKINY